MDTMLSIISYSLNNQNIIFDPQHQHVRCLAHIINLAVKKALEDLSASGLDIDENILEEETDENSEKLKNIIYKVILK
jgi:hypothetical protein